MPATRRELVWGAAALLVLVLITVGVLVARDGGEQGLTVEDGASETAQPEQSPTVVESPSATADAGPDAESPTGAPTTAAEAEPASAQLRGIWVHLFDRSLKTSDGIQEFLDTADAANMNTVIVQAARRHDAFYGSGVLPPTTDEELAPGLDVLGELIPAAHERGLQVHVWYSIVPSMHKTMLEEDLQPEHLHTRHGFGSPDPWLQQGNDRTYAYIDPAIPGFQDHVVAMLRDVVERYDVDGVHLDYLRYECLQATDDGGCTDSSAGDPATGNQHPITMQRYDAHGEGTLGDFMRKQTQDLVRRIYIEVAEVDPSVVVSAALIAQSDGPGADRDAFANSKAYWNKGQDWASWIEEGIIDHAYPMVYFRDNDSRWAQAYDSWVAFSELIDTDQHVTAIGQGAYLNCVQDSLDQLEQAAGATDGVVVYSYQGDVVGGGKDCPADQLGDMLDALGQGMFAEPAPVPEVPRKTDPTAGHVLVDVTDGQTVTLTAPGEEPRERRADATGHAGFVWVPAGEWELAVDGGEPVPITVVAGEVSRASTADGG